MKKSMTAASAWIVVLLILSQVAFAGSTLDYGQLTGIPADGTVTYIAYLTETNGDEILTEDNNNADLGPDQGYQSGYWLLPVANFDTENNGDEVQIYFTGIGAQAGNAGNLTFNWDSTTGYTGHGTVAFGSSTNPATPENLTVNWNDPPKRLELAWNDNTGGTATYRLYRSTQGATPPPSERSIGRYYRVTTFTYQCTAGSCSGQDTSPVGEQRNWYIVVAEGSLSGHSNEDWADVPEIPEAVTLASFTAKGDENTILIEWETATEVEALGFNLYRAENPEGERRQLNAELIPCQAPGSPVGASYQFQDASVATGVTYYYWLEGMDTHGKSTLYGPVDATLVDSHYRLYLPLIARD
jgi:hypothetical protein